ncbi:AI-2E family transporter [Rhizobium halophilum]|uniref:AI-2E family transporter n=1 Tax=Rhizobium halophilum TaxID=2846852 RepID=UPI001EFE37D1|nr:AI-2E family transporter [Rhizobium halophilum]MCF6369895.1 AI-2E family transporter [Rhizobium halophilum]
MAANSADYMHQDGGEDMVEKFKTGSKPEGLKILKVSLIVGGVISGALLLWQLSSVLLLFFAAIVAAVILRSGAKVIEDHTPIDAPWSLVICVLALALIVAGFLYLLGAQIVSEATTVVQRLPEMINSLGERIGIHSLYGRLEDRAGEFAGGGNLVAEVAGYSSALVGVLANVLLVMAAGIYLAARPKQYSRGILRLVPPRVRDRASVTFGHSGEALRLWLLGQLVSMTVVGVLVTLGLYVLGMPSALALGFLAGVSEFVPIVGPILSAVPALLIALSEGGSSVLWVLLLYILVQQIEGNIIMPLVQRRTVDLPPVLTLFALVALGTLFGPLGVLLGTPLTVVLYVVVKDLYLGETLHEDVKLPGKD